jgi:nuclear pore complex protein Nup54
LEPSKKVYVSDIYFIMAFSFKPAFGATTTTTTSTTGGIFGGFGSTLGPSTFGTSTAPTGFGAASSAPSFGTTGIAPAFGVAATTTSLPSFGFGTTATSAPGFGFGSTTVATGFGFGSNAASNTTSGFSGFGSGTTGVTGTTTFGALGGVATTGQQQQQQANQVVSAVSTPVIYTDERDTIIAKWNQLQAFWGTGRGYFNPQGQSVEFTADNPYSFFKAVGYNCLPNARNEDGLVSLTFDRKMSEVCDNQQAVIDTLQRIVVPQPNNINAQICVEGMRPLIDNKTEMVIYVQQRANTGVITRFVAVDLFNHLNGLRQQLQSQLSVSSLVPKTGMTSEQKKLYLDNPPAGIDVRIWEQAKLDNPDQEKMIPVPMVGFMELHNRLKHQEQQTALHQARLDLIANDIATLQNNQTDGLAKMEQYKRNQVLLGHRILKVLVKQEMCRKQGYSIQIDDEQLRARLETIYTELNAPMQFKGRLNELMSQMRMQNQVGSSQRSEVTYQIDSTVQLELKKLLKRQQEGIGHLINIIKDDFDVLQTIETKLNESTKHVKR